MDRQTIAELKREYIFNNFGKEIYDAIAADKELADFAKNMFEVINSSMPIVTKDIDDKTVLRQYSPETEKFINSFNDLMEKRREHIINTVIMNIQNSNRFDFKDFAEYLALKEVINAIRERTGI